MDWGVGAARSGWCRRVLGRSEVVDGDVQVEGGDHRRDFRIGEVVALLGGGWEVDWIGR